MAGISNEALMACSTAFYEGVLTGLSLKASHKQSQLLCLNTRMAVMLRGPHGTPPLRFAE